MLGIIGFNSYRVSCMIGTLPHEREQEQDLFIDLKVQMEFSSVCNSDSLLDTLDYTVLASVCQHIAQQTHYHLLEKYAGDVIQELFKQFPIKAAWIRVKKPLAIPEARYAFVELRRYKY